MNKLEHFPPVVLNEDLLSHLETRLGPGVRLMGPWQTDGVFGYIAISFEILQQAADAMDDPNVGAAVAHLNTNPNRTGKFVDLVETVGPALVERIIAAHMFSLASSAKVAAQAGT